MKKNVWMWIGVGVMLAAMVSFYGCGGSSGGSSPSPSPEIDQNAMLNKLGVDTDIGLRQNPVNYPVEKTYNPTLRSKTQLLKRNEVFLAGIPAQGNNAGWTPSGTVHAFLDWEDGATAFTPSNLAGDDSWLRVPKTAASGDVDGDGVDEIVVVYLKTSSATLGMDRDLAFGVIKKDAGGYKIIADGVLASFPNSSITEYPNDNWWMNNFNAVCGDTDGNGQAETMIAFNGSVYLIGDAYKEFGTLKTIAYAKSGDTAYKLLKISAGDLDNDGTDEFVVVENSLKSNTLTGSALYHIYSGITLTQLSSDTISVTKGATTITLHAANCAVGDVDGDGLNDVLFVGEPENSGTYYMITLMTTWDDDAGKFTYDFKQDYEDIAARAAVNITPICAVADFDGDGKKEMMAYRYVYENLSQSGGAFTQKPGIDMYFAIGSAWDCSAAVGDVDGDGMADVLMITDGFYELYCMGYNKAGQWVRKGTGDIGDTGAYYPYVTVGDYDGDSITVEFVDSELLFSDPHPIAVIAANPFWSDSGMTGSTSFGKTTGSDVETTKSVGFKVGFSIGYESEGLFDLWDVSLKTTFESSFDWTATQSYSYEESYSYTTENEDMVVFTAIPYDVYYYKVISAPDADMVGKIITVNLPRKPITIQKERGYYNANNGTAPDIDSTIVTHTVGNPLSYPSSSGADELIAGGGGQGVKSSSTMYAGKHYSGETALTISQTLGNGTGSSFDLSVTVEAEAGAGGFKAGVSNGFHYGEGYSVTTSTGTEYSGSVGNVPDSYGGDADKSFNWGLFTYRAAVGSEKFIVVQYYMD